MDEKEDIKRYLEEGFACACYETEQLFASVLSEQDIGYFCENIHEIYCERLRVKLEKKMHEMIDKIS